MAELIGAFRHELEIILLGEWTAAQTAVISTNVPGIGLLDSDDPSAMLDMMRKGCYLALHPLSTVPEVLVRNLENAPQCWGRGGSPGSPKSCNTQIRVTPQGTWCPPMKRPILLPPMARYTLGSTVSAALRSIGGVDDDNTPASQYLHWPFVIEASDKPFDRPWASGCYRPRLMKTLNKATTGTKILYTPLLEIPIVNNRSSEAPRLHFDMKARYGASYLFDRAGAVLKLYNAAGFQVGPDYGEEAPDIDGLPEWTCPDEIKAWDAAFLAIELAVSGVTEGADGNIFAQAQIGVSP